MRSVPRSIALSALLLLVVAGVSVLAARPGAALLHLPTVTHPEPEPEDERRGEERDEKPAAKEASEDETPWKVTDPHGPYDTVSFTTDEGTWLSLDVHPEGRTIVFALLGDLYTMPIEGGDARRITSGTAWDAQPRYSPDGRLIAFASDRGGTENLWICDLDGRNARQVSREKATFINSPAWSPDGDYLVGRKRLTDQSSLGTVELWMWHLRGGEGVQITKREEQPDAADPAFSRDGRFIYFSARDARYQYNRDVYEGIWQVKRFDRRTGQTSPVTGEAGGAAAPAFSPDGRTMSFVRRASTRTVLELMDTSTGALRRLTNELSRDNQEGFAFHGVYPGYAWTPDGREIVATAEGRIWRWDVATGSRRPVPFRAQVEQRVTRALRFPQRLGGDSVRARIIRWPVQSPDGRHVVFSAAGHLYVMALPSGRPRRLTSVGDLEYAPAFSPDGARLAYVTWNDLEGGHVWCLDTSDLSDESAPEPRRVTELPGQYVNPSFSPDGRLLVYVRGSGATFRDNDLSDELWTEIHTVSADGGPSTFVISTQNRGANRRMARPTFSAAGDRIFFVEDEPAGKPATPPKTVLVSVKLDGTDRRTHLRWDRAEEAMVSPDGRWVVFSEQHDAFLTALPMVGTGAVDVALESAALPVRRLTREGGEWVAWADGGRTVTWVYGPTFHRAELDQAMPMPPTEDEEAAKKAKADEEAEKAAAESRRARRGRRGKEPVPAPKPKKKDDLPESEAIEITLTLPRARPTETVAYTNARIVTMKGDEVIERGTIVVEGDRIARVGAAGSVQVPGGARTVDLAGRTIIPGLFDAHAHLHYSTLDIFPQRPWKYLANLAYGITTTHDPSASTHEVFAQAEMVEAGLMIGPRVFSTGFILYGADLPGRAKVESLDDARHHLRRMKSLGAFTVKSYMQPRREQRQWIIQAAREEKLMVVPEGGGDLESDMTMILDGHTTIEHALPVAPLHEDVVTLFGRSGTAYVPTLLVAYGGLSGDLWFHQHYDLWKDPRLTRFVPPGVLDPLTRIRSVMAPDEEWHHVAVASSAREVLEAGGRVLLGGHGQMQGLGPHWELWAFVQGGMTPLEALRVGTLHPAEALGLERDLGSIEAGKLADFVVLERNPLEKIENSESVELVVKNGVAYTPAQLERQVKAAPGSK